MSRTGAPAASVPARALRAVLDHVRAKPIVVRRRRIYAFDLADPIPRVDAALALRFEIEPETAGVPGGGEGTDAEFVFRALAGAEVAYRMRLAVGRADLLPLLRGCVVPPRPIFLYDCFTEPKFRGRGAYPASLAHALRFARERRYDRAYIRVERGNVASARGIERAGFRPAAVIVHAALFGFPLGPYGRAATWPPVRAAGGEREPE